MSRQFHGLLATSFFIRCCRSWCVSDIVAGLMMFHCPLGCLFGWAWLLVVFLAVGILCIAVWGGLLLGSSCIVRRVVGLLWWVCICVLFSYVRSLFLILRLGHVFLERVVLRSCGSHFWWLAVVVSLRFSIRCSNGVRLFALGGQVETRVAGLCCGRGLRLGLG